MAMCSPFHSIVRAPRASRPRLGRRSRFGSRRVALIALACAAWVFPACSRSNNLLFGRVETTVGGHPVIVTDCYRTSVAPPVMLTDATGKVAGYRFAPCRDAVIELRSGDDLVVNGVAYGRVRPGDRIMVDHGRVLVNDHPLPVPVPGSVRANP